MGNTTSSSPPPSTPKLRRTAAGVRYAVVPAQCGGVTAIVGVATGSRDEHPDHRGVAHLLEHALFKGTEAFEDQAALAKRLNTVGGSFNASTSAEVTQYYVRLPDADSLDEAIFALAEMTLRPKLRDQDIRDEIDVVCEEIAKVEDDTEQRHAEHSMRTLYGDHALGRRIAGTAEQVRGLSPDYVRDFWRTHYHPSRLFVVVSGCDERRARGTIERHFGCRAGSCSSRAPARHPNAAVVIPRAPPPPEPATPRSTHAEDTAQTHITLSFPAPPAARSFGPLAATLDVLCGCMGGHMSSRLWIAVREREQLAYSVRCDSVSGCDAAAAFVTLGVSGGAQRARRALEVCERELFDGPRFTDEEVALSKRTLLGHLALGESSAMHARLGISSLASAGRVLTLGDVRGAVAAVTAEEVRALNRRVVLRGSMALTSLGAMEE